MKWSGLDGASVGGCRFWWSWVVRSLGCLILLLLGAWSPLMAQSEARKPIVVGIDRDYPPFEYVDKAGQPAGYDVDLIRAVAAVMNLEIRIQPGVWDDLKKGLESGEVDVLTGMLRSEERARFADFTQPHLTIHYSIFIRKGTRGISSVEDLRGREVLVGRGTQMHEHLVTLGFQREIVTTDTEPDALRLLASGRGDAALLPHIQGVLEVRGSRLKNIEPVGKPVLEREACLAVKKGNEALRTELDTGLAILHQTGDYQTLYSRWFGTLQDDQAAFRKVLRASVFFLVPLLVLVLAGFGWNWSLRRRVQKRTQELQRAMHELDRSQAFLATVVDRIPMILIGKDPRDGLRYTMWNKAAEDITGVGKADALGRTDFELFPEHVAQAFRDFDRKVLDGGGDAQVVEEPLETRHKGTRLVRIHKAPLRSEDGEPLLLLGVGEDLTEVRKMEEAMRQAQRLESLGVLAGGLAHDFNNLLTAMMANLSLVEHKHRKGAPIDAHLKTIEEAVQRAANLSKQMLAYSGRGVFVVRPIDLNPLVRELFNLLDVSISKKIEKVFQLAEGLPCIQGDERQIQQVVMNLVTNAAEAIGDHPGTILVASAFQRFDASELADLYPGQGLPSGDYVTLSVQDTGCGIPPEAMAHLFEPFFTTKFAGRGLGLSALQGIIKGHQGGIRVRSTPGQGSTFIVCFPAASDEAIGVPPSEDPDWKARSGVVLVVDDEIVVRRAQAELLRHLGFEAVEAADGEQALAIFSQDPDRFLLAVVDITMPRMDGWETLAALQRLRPGFRVVLTSGYHELESRDASQVAGFLPKPFLVKDLKAVLGRVLDG